MEDVISSSDNGRLPDLFTSMRWAALARHIGLTPRQAEVAWWVCRGYRPPTIAKYLGVTTNTVRMHVQTLFKKLDIHDRIGIPVCFVLADRALVCSESGGVPSLRSRNGIGSQERLQGSVVGEIAGSEAFGLGAQRGQASDSTVHHADAVDDVVEVDPVSSRPASGQSGEPADRDDAKPKR